MKYHCDFCAKPDDQVRIVLVANYPDETVAICAGCALIAARGAVLSALEVTAHVEPQVDKRPLTPARKERG